MTALIGLNNMHKNRKAQVTEGLSRRIVDLHVLKYCRFQYHQFKQLYINTSYSNASSLCQGLKDDPNCHRPRRENWLGCAGTTQKPSLLKPSGNILLCSPLKTNRVKECCWWKAGKIFRCSDLFMF